MASLKSNLPESEVPYQRPTVSRLNVFIHSVRFRLTLWFAAILIIVLAVLSGFVFLQQASFLGYTTLNRLELKDRQLVAFFRFAGLTVSANGQLSVPQTDRTGQPLLQEDEVLTIIGPQGQVLLKQGTISDNDADRLSRQSLQLPAGVEAFRFRLRDNLTAGNAPRDYIFIATPLVSNEGNLGFMLLGRPVDPTGQLHRLFFTLVIANLGTLLLALAGGYLLADRAMRPVHTITSTARQIGETDLSRRLNLKTQDELGELANTFDQMLDRLQAAFQRQRQFTADASHELRTPLTIVNLEAGRALATRRTAQEYERALSIIQSENDYMSHLVNELLTLARMDAGQAMLRTEELDLSDLTLEVVERLAPLANRSGVELATGELPELPIRGDRQYLIQMLTNLVENAIKYSSGPLKKVRVEVGRSMASSPEMGWVKVSDTGPGIPAEDIPHIFDRFYRVDKARSRNPQDSPKETPEDERPTGSGLGLSIAQWIAQAHGGEIRVSSELGKGSTFEVSLPLQEANSNGEPEL